MATETGLPASPLFWLLNGESPSGPFSTEQIHAKLSDNEISWETLACRMGQGTWQALRLTPGIGPTVSSSQSQQGPRAAEQSPSIPETLSEPSTVRFKVTCDVPLSIDGLREWCELRPNEATNRLLGKELEQFFEASGRTDLARIAAEARGYSSVPADCLDRFLQKIKAQQVTTSKNVASVSFDSNESPRTQVPATAAQAPSAVPLSRRPNQSSGSWAGLVVLLLIGLGIWYFGFRDRPAENGAGNVALGNDPGPRDVTYAFLTAPTRAEAEKYCTLNLIPLLDELDKEPASEHPDDKVEVLDEQDAPNGIGGKYVWYRGRLYNPEMRRLVQMDGFCHVIRAEKWKVDDWLVTAFDHQTLEQPVSLVAMARNEQERRRAETSSRNEKQSTVKSPNPWKTNPSPRINAPKPKTWYETVSPWLGRALFIGAVGAIWAAMRRRGTAA